ncbi:hypothetical protein CBM2634_B160284 [Cupriavidus taiwanensis]|uniref:Uncharacterized protein n=1 Tax=Cupriavidus taiwanensis TaxID=164546 RepID=A0A375J5D5_9BURK|nr:hypothetical protein CBM2634_B160284 [Cupriavidus taiwanensis]
MGRARKHGGPPGHRECHRRRDRAVAQHVRQLPRLHPGRAYRRVFRRQYRVPPGDRAAVQVADHHGHDPQHLYPRARDPEDDDLAERPRGALDRRPPAHHRGAGEAGHRTGRAAGAAALAGPRRLRGEALRFPGLKQPGARLGKAADYGPPLCFGSLGGACEWHFAKWCVIYQCEKRLGLYAGSALKTSALIPSVTG